MARAQEDYDYYDEFGETINSEDSLETDTNDMTEGEMIADEELSEPIAGDEFHETLRHTDSMSDQLDDPELSAAAEADYGDADGIDDEARVRPVEDEDLAA